MDSYGHARWPTRVALRPFFRGWFRARTHDESGWCYPAGPPVVSILGADPARILLIGDGPAAGYGVLTHHLGVAGHLARHLAERLDRGVVVTVAARPGDSAHSTLRRIRDQHLGGYHAIVLMLATTDALCLTSRRSWARSMTGLVRTLTSAGSASVFVTTTASVRLARPLSPFRRRVAGEHARMLDAETRRICTEAATPMIRLNAAGELTPRTYAMWGRRIGAHVVRALRPDASPGPTGGSTSRD